MLTLYYFTTQTITQFISLVVWWYSRGFVLYSKHMWFEQRTELVRIGVHTWIKHFFQPMFQDYTVIGRLLSIGFRFFIIIGKLVRTIIGLLLRIFMWSMWVLIPLIVLFGLLNIFVFNT